MGKRTKLILGIIIGAMIVFSGAILGLAKYGIINLKGFADPLYGKVEITVDASNTGGGISLYQGTTAISATGSFVGNVYTITSLAYGNYTYKFGMPGPDGQPCLGPVANLTHSSTTTRTTYARFTCDDGGSGGGTGDVCSTTAPCQTGLNCTNGTCQTAGGVGATYCVRGRIQNASTGVAIQGAKAIVGSMSGTTDSFGIYQVNNLTFANLSTDKIRFTKDGFASTAEQNITSLNSNIVASIPCDISSNNNLGTSSLTTSAPAQANTFSEIGTIKDQRGNLIGEVTVRVSCNNSDQILGVACESSSISWQSASHSTLQSYYSGLPATKTFNYDVPNINRYSNYTSFPRLRITFSKSGYFWDQNGDNIDNDSGVTTFIPKPTTSYVVNGNQTYFNFNNITLLERKTFTVTGKIYKTLGGLLPATNAKVTVFSADDDVELGSNISRNTVYWPSGYPSASQIGNYAIEDIPWNPGYRYKVKIESLDPKLFFSAEETIEFSSDQISFNPIYKKQILILKTEFLSPKNFSQVVNFKNAISGEDIDMSNEVILENELLCYDATNENCVEGDPEIYQNSIKYKIDPSVAFSVLQLNFETENFESMLGSLYITIGESTVYLFSKNSTNFSENLSTNEVAEIFSQIDQELFGCQIIETVKFCTFKATSTGLFVPAKISQMTNYAKIIKAMSNLSGVKLPPFIFLWPTGYESPLRGFTFALPNMPIFLSESALNQNIGIDSLSVLIHEYGHFIFYNSSKFDLDSKIKIEDAYEILTDNASACIQSLSPNYTCFSYYGATESGEFFAEYYQWWIQNLDEMERLINDPVFNQPELEHCKNTMMMMDQLLQEKFPRMKRFKRVAKVSQSTENRVAGTVSTDSENAEFLINTMSSFGFEVASGHAYESISSLTNMPLTKDQIKKGLWIKSNYDKLTRSERLRLAISIQTQKAENLISKAGNLTLGTIRKTLSSINNSVEQTLIALGFNITNTRISGTIKDQDGPIEGMMVTMGNKTDISGSDGWYSISRTKTGSLGTSIIDPKINRTYSVTPSLVSLNNNQQLTKDLSIYRKRYLLSGVIYNGNSTLNNGSISVVGGLTYPLDNNGKFSFRLKEGRYRFVIKNKNGATKAVTNSGLFGDISRLNVTSDLNSIIWVKQ